MGFSDELSAYRIRRGAVASTPGSFSSFFVDFTTQGAEDPASLSGSLSNNTQGVAGNTAPTSGTSMRLAALTGTSTIVCCGSTAAQGGYEDSFAFYTPSNLSAGANLRITATTAVAAGYNPSDNHEIELILGCKTSSLYHRWIECLWSINGSLDLLSLDGDFINGTFQSIDGSTGLLSGPMANNDKFVAEWYRSANRIRWGRIRSGTTVWGFDLTDAAHIDSSLGTGMGLAAFRRSIAPDSVSASLGFYDMLIEAF